MTISESSEGLSVMTMLVVAAAPVPPVVVSASPVHVPAAMAAPMPDLNHSAVRRGYRAHAQPGGSGDGHCQQRKTNQGDTSHTVSSRSRDCDVWHKLPVERLFRAHEVNDNGVFEPAWAWSVYLLVNRGIDENDARRDVLAEDRDCHRKKTA